MKERLGCLGIQRAAIQRIHLKKDYEHCQTAPTHMPKGLRLLSQNNSTIMQAMVQTHFPFLHQTRLDTLFCPENKVLSGFSILLCLLENVFAPFLKKLV